MVLFTERPFSVCVLCVAMGPVCWALDFLRCMSYGETGQPARSAALRKHAVLAAFAESGQVVAASAVDEGQGGLG